MDQRARQDAPLVLHEHFEQRVFAAGQVNRLPVDGDGVAEQVEADAGVIGGLGAG